MLAKCLDNRGDAAIMLIAEVIHPHSHKAAEAAVG
jgi:hypothetical protein